MSSAAHPLTPGTRVAASAGDERHREAAEIRASVTASNGTPRCRRAFLAVGGDGRRAMAPLRTRPTIERLAVLCALSIPLAGPAWGACVDIKSPDLSFAGTLGFRIFPGPPNFADVRKGDTPEPAYLLKLDQPICATGDAALPTDHTFDQIELLPDHSVAGRQLSAALRHLIGQRVSIAGKPALAAGTAHHHAPLMLA